jgi:hypothetical protein
MDIQVKSMTLKSTKHLVRQTILLVHRKNIEQNAYSEHPLHEVLPMQE